MGYKKITLILWLSIFLSAERSANAQSISFNYTGAQQTWTVPTCVSQITVTMQGGAGGNANYCIGNGYYNGEGEGGTVVGTLTVTVGQVIYVNVGGRGADGITYSPGAAGGWNGGGSGAYYNGSFGGGGGGGESDIRTGGNAYANVVAVAGGGGGEAYNYGCGTEMGGSGGTSTGQCGFEDYTSYCGSPNPPGGGGSQGAGGAGGYLGGYCTAYAGTQGQGGAGGSCNNDGGGGGGGYYGGGGGVWGGGGGGSSYISGLTSVISNTMGGCTTNGTITIQYGAVSLAASVVTNVRCHGGSTGSTTCTVSGGSTPYTYAWAPGGQSTQTAVGLSAGTYVITVSIPCGGSSTASVTVTQPAALGVTAAVNTNVACNGGNGGKITCAPSNGTSPYTYLWNNAQTTVATTGLTAGSYTVTVTDNCGATATVAATVTQPAVLIDSAYNLKNVLCNGGANGSVGSLATGGTRPYTYLWAPTARTTDTIVGLSAGTYTITVTDSHGCSTTSSAIVTQPTVLQDSVFVIANVLCNGQNNASIGSSVMGGVSPYTYLWNPGGQTTASATFLTAGTYSLSVHDSNGCTASGSITVTQPNVLTATATAYSNVVCNGGSDGNAYVMPMGGTLPYTYSWTPGGASTDTAMGLSAGTYTVNVWDINDCNTSTTVTVTQPIALIVGAGTVLNNLCNGDNIGMAVGYVSGGPAPYTYSWTPSGGNGDTASGLSVGTYTVNVVDINGCTGSAMTTVTQPTALSIILNSVPDDGSCSGSAWLQVTGGVGPYTYLWESGGVTSYIISNQCAGNYCCRVTDANGCYDNVCVDISSYLGVNSLNANSGGIKIYPNPTNGQFTIENVSVSESSVVEVYNVLGEEVYSAAVDTKQGGTTTVNIGNEPNGVYVYRVKSLNNGNVLGQGKIVLEK